MIGRGRHWGSRFSRPVKCVIILLLFMVAVLLTSALQDWVDNKCHVYDEGLRAMNDWKANPE